MPIKAFLFDLDGLLADTEAIHMRAFAQTANQLGHPSEPKDFLKWIGHSSLDLGNWLAARSPSGMTGQEIMDLEQRLFLEILRRDRPAPFAGAKEFFDHADQNSLPRALVSNTHYTLAASVLEILLPHMKRSTDLTEHFRHFATGDRVPRLKPAPDPYQQAAKALGLEPGECLAFEDSVAGATSARDAGCKVCAIPNIYLDSKPIEQIAHVSYNTLHAAYAARVWETV